LNKRWTSIAWAIAAVVLLLSIGHPIQLITMSFMAIPFVILYVTQSVKSFIIHVVALLLAVFFLGGSLGSVMVLASLYFIIPGIVIGLMFKRGKSGWHVFVSGMIAFLVESLFLLALTTLVMNFDLTEFIRSQMNLSMEAIQQTAGLTDEQLADFIDSLVIMLNQMIPVMLIMSSLMLGAVTYSISRRLLTAQGVNVNKMKPVKEWMLPRSLIWYYLLTIVLEIIAGNSTSGFLVMILINLVPLIQLAFVVQGISFVFFFADHKRWPKALPVVVTIAVAFVPPLYYLLRIVGIVDMAFPMRQLITRPKQ